MFYFNSQYSFGCDWDGTSLHAVILSKEGGSLKLQDHSVVLLDSSDPTQFNKTLDNNESFKQLLQQKGKCIITSILRADEVLVRPLEVKLKKIGDVDKVLAFQAEPLIPYPIENAIIDRMVISSSQEGIRLTIIATKKDCLERHLKDCQAIGIEPEIVSAIPVVLAAFSQSFVPSEEPMFILHIGKKETVLLLAKTGLLIASQSLPLGFNHLQEALKKNSPEEILTPELFDSLSEERAPALFAAIESWRLELTRVLYALAKQNRNQSIDQILFTGFGATFSSITDSLVKKWNKQLILPEVSPSFGLSREQCQLFALSLGAALSALSPKPINFRQNEFVYPDPWKWLKKPMALYFCLCLILSIAIYLFTIMHVKQQENELRQEYLNLLAEMNTSYNLFEQKFENKYPHRETEDGEILASESLSMEEISQRLQILQKELKDNPETMALLPGIPRVSDLLAWLSTHPLIESGSTGTPPIQIESLNYSMVKRPELKKKQEKYQVKVELEFSTTTPKIAREFHDALIIPNDFIDPKAEVKWSSNRGKYRASFFLKDKTVYNL